MKAKVPASSAQVAERAYSIWEKEGRPNGQDVAHWLRAEAELGASATPAPGKPRKAKASTAATRVRKTSSRSRGH